MSNFRHLKSVGMLVLLALAGLGTSYAASSEERATDIGYAQQTTGGCSGVVKDEAGQPILGATVTVNGTTAGATTNLDGTFTIPNVAKGATIKVAYIGYTTVEMPWNGANLTIVLKEDAESIGEVVVTGYGGKQSRAKVTNSIAKVNEEALTVGTYSNPAQALAGSVSGLKVTQTSGNPGSTPKITLRGGTSFKDGVSNEPLIIVDGQLRSSMGDINPADIESMSVMKDAGATALYGARASNGVILITTKTGKAGHSSVNLSAKWGLNYFVEPFEMLGAKDYITAMRTAYATNEWGAPVGNLTGASAFGTGNVYGDHMVWNIMGKTADNEWLLDKGWKEMADPLDPSKTIIYKDTRVKDYNLNSPSFTQDYNVNFQGGNDKGTYYAGLGYYNAEGLPVTSFYERYSFIFNGSYKIKPWLESVSNFSYNRANWQSMPGTNTGDGNYFGRTMSAPPTSRFEDEEGNMCFGSSTLDGNQAFQPEKFQRFNQNDKFTMVQSLTATLYEGLTLKGTMNWYYSESLAESFNKDYQSSSGGGMNRDRNSSASFDRYFDQTYNLVLNYQHTFAEKHNLNILLGTEYYDQQRRGFSASGSKGPTEDFADLGYTDPGENMRSIDSWHEERKIMSYFGRLEYDYADKYLFAAVFRQDGYSSLIDNRWGFFPGVSAGWVFSKENFIQDNASWLSYGKLRASYGVNGNASGISAYELQGSYVQTNNEANPPKPLNYNGNAGYLIGSLPNRSLRWEKTKTFEVGLDLSFFNNRLNANFTFYNRLTSDKYAAKALPSTTGFSSVTNNNGEYRNRGLEIELSAKILRKGDFSWDFNGNITYNKNTIVKLPYNGLPNNRDQSCIEIYTGRQLADGTYETKWVGGLTTGFYEGCEPGSLVGYVAQGVYRSIEDIPGNLVDKSGNDRGQYMYGPAAWAALTDTEKANAIELKPGDMRWKDINGDGIIDSKDQVKIGNLQPHWTGGFNTTFRWKGLQLYARFDFALDYWVYDGAKAWFMGCMQGTFNTTTDWHNTFSAENPNAKYPRYVWADQYGAKNYRTSTLMAAKGNYLAVRELQLSYTLPKSWTKKFHCEKLELSITGQNLGYWSTCDLANPEVSNNTLSGSTYPLPRILLFGVNMTF